MTKLLRLLLVAGQFTPDALLQKLCKWSQKRSTVNGPTYVIIEFIQKNKENGAPGCNQTDVRLFIINDLLR